MPPLTNTIWTTVTSCRCSCSSVEGENPAGTRFEPHVFKRLKQVRDGKRTQYEHVTAWPPCGCLRRGAEKPGHVLGAVPIDGLQMHFAGRQNPGHSGPSGHRVTVQTGSTAPTATECDAAEFRDCFHIHNAGTPYPEIWPSQNPRSPVRSSRSGHDGPVRSATHATNP